MKHKRQYKHWAAEQQRVGAEAPEPAEVSPVPFMVEKHLDKVPNQAEVTISNLDATSETTDVSPTESVATDVAIPAVADTGATGPLSLTFESSNVRVAALDEVSGVVSVTFTNGKTYRYGGFSRALMAAWGAAQSAGKWFNANVKNQAEDHPLIVEQIGA